VNYAQSAEIGLETPFMPVLAIASTQKTEKLAGNFKENGVSPEEMSVNYRFSAAC
jgi:hypothetical protein